MAKSKPAPDAPSTVERVIESIRGRILRGRLKPGDRLPTRQELMMQHRTSLATVQLAVDILVADGFIEVGAPKHGTRVSLHPPHLSHYKFVFPTDASARNLVWKTMRSVAEIWARENNRRVSWFHGVAGHADIQAYESVIQDIKSHRVAGLIFALCGETFDGTPLVDHPGIARAAVALPSQMPGVPKVAMDYQSFFDQAVAFLVARGRTRIALVAPTSWATDNLDELLFVRALRGRSLNVEPAHLQFVDLWNVAATRHTIHLLFHRDQRRRPDAVIIADDNLIVATGQGLHQAGIGAGAVDVVAMVNYPDTPPSPIPYHAIGFDMNKTVGALTRLIDLQVQGKPVPESTLIGADIVKSKA